MNSQYQGKTAVVTGASSGLGVEFAMQLATAGANLVLVARRKDRMTALAKTLEAQHKVSVTVISLDLSTADAGTKLMAELAKQKLAVDVLVNNAGFGFNGRVINEDRALIRDEITLNVLTLTDLTIAVLPEMVKRGFGVIINIGSTASFQPVPGMAVYAATKSYVRSFTEALWGELSGTGVKVIALNPGATETEFFEVAGTKPVTVLATASEVVAVVMKELEKSNPRPSIIAGWRNKLLAGTTRFAPTKTIIKIAGSMFLTKR